MRIFSRYFIAFCVFVCASTISYSFGYFEHKYLCTVEGASIQVSIQTGEQLCFEYLALMDTEIRALEADIARASRYFELGNETDKVYRTTVIDGFMIKKQEWISLRERFVVVVDDYEKDLFLSVKGLVSFYLKPERESIVAKIAQAEVLLARLKLVGDVDKYEFVLEQLTELQEKLSLLDRIWFAVDFDDLIPPLKTYLGLPATATYDDLT